MVDIIPASSAITNAAITMQNGFIVCDWPSSRSFCSIVGNGCGHFWFCLIQLAHDFERSLYSWSSCSSLATADFGTHPRSHCRAFSASVVRFFASSQIGVSGSYNKQKMIIEKKKFFLAWVQVVLLTKSSPMTVRIGMNMHTNPTCRHGINVFNVLIKRMPSVTVNDE